MKSKLNPNSYKLLYAFFALSIIFCGNSQSFPQKRSALGWVWQNPLPQGNPLYAIHFTKNKETGFAVGADDTILATTDGGFNWQRQLSPVDATLSGVFVKDTRNAFIVGVRGTLLSTVNGGKDWKQVEIPIKDHLYSITFAGESLNAGWAVGTNGNIIKTTDGGLTWKQETMVGTNEHLLKVAAFDAQKSVVVGMNGTILTFDSENKNWRLNTPCEGALMSGAAYLSAETIIAVGYGGALPAVKTAAKLFRK